MRKDEQKEMILSKELSPFNEIQNSKLMKYNMVIFRIYYSKNEKEGIFYNDNSIKDELDKINKLQCWIPNCPDSQVYNTIAFLKKHLKEKHQRYLWFPFEI